MELFEIIKEFILEYGTVIASYIVALVTFLINNECIKKVFAKLAGIDVNKAVKDGTTNITTQIDQLLKDNAELKALNKELIEEISKVRYVDKTNKK